MSNKLDQLINLKFLIKLGKDEHEAFHLLKKVYGKRCISHANARVYFVNYSKDLEEDSKVEEIKDVSMSMKIIIFFSFF